MNIHPGGTSTTIANFPFPDFFSDGYELDHDGRWVLSVNSPHTYPRKNYILGVDHSTGVITTFTQFNTNPGFNEITIDRDPGSHPGGDLPYVIVTWSPAWMLRANRLGTMTTLAMAPGIQGFYAVEVHPRSGDYIVGGSTGLLRVDKMGAMNTLYYPSIPNAIKITQDDFAWVVHVTAPPAHSILKYDLSQKAVVTMFSSGVPQGQGITGIEVYGSRSLVCRQAPTAPGVVTVNVQSRDSLAAGASYILAASPARRPGMKFPNGEWLDLDVTHPLFITSALGWAPGTFQDFQGTLDSKGNASAQVNIPPGLPKMNDMAIFVAGVIYRGTNILEVTNTHWFVL